MYQNLLFKILRKYLSIKENFTNDIGSPKNVLIVRQHNQLGDLLACVSIFRALKEKLPDCKITLIVSPANYPAVIKNKLIDRCFIFDKRKLLNPFYLISFIKLLRESYDLAIVPVTVAISFTSNLMARISNSKIRIGVKELSGMPNPYDFFFDRRIVLDWRKYPDMNVSDFSLDILRPFGISTENLKSEISFNKEDEKVAEEFLLSNNVKKDSLIVGLHIGAGKPPNRWSVEKFIELTARTYAEFSGKETLRATNGEIGHIQFYLTGSNSDLEIIDYLQRNISLKIPVFLNRQIPEVAALISKSTLFITNDTGIMHVAGATNTPQVSIFGPTNPFNWAPLGSNKLFIRRSEFINDITVEEVYDLCKSFLSARVNELENAK